ncbi:MAG: cytochrome c3 family protein [Phycisphaerales bacterium]
MLVATIVGAAAFAAHAQQFSVVDTPHNLSASGPGPVRAATENEVCIFCHAPHNSSPVRPLWNRAMPGDAYSIYTSRSLDANPGQPTGTSKMCLSCHDGTIALGAVISRGAEIQMSGGVTTMPEGHGRIGTDLRDDHPISFRFDSALAAHDPRLKSPASLPQEMKLDQNQELQCTTCHDAHNNRYGNFLVMQNTRSQLCMACHNVGRTTITEHSNCNACHQPHTAPSGPYLLRGRTITETCTRCHDGTVPGAANILADLAKFSVHDTQSPVDPPAPAIEHTSCVSCHDPHTMGRGSSAAPGIAPNFGRIAGQNASGASVSISASEYQVCLRCHGDGNRLKQFVRRLIPAVNARMEFGSNAVSFHPVEVPGRNPDVPSLLPPWTTASVMHCSECHSSEQSRAAFGAGPSGTHGSVFAPLLTNRYEVEDYTSESASAYALCYRCHDRTNILDNTSFPTHRLHIVDKQTPCAACHDAHGIPSGQGNPFNNSHLINFATSIVRPDPRTGKTLFRDLGRYSGECFLSCHGANHSPAKY